MNKSRTSKFQTRVFQVLSTLLIAILALSIFAPATSVSAQSGTYPLAGASYPAENFSGMRLPAYDSVWTPDGRNYQPMLPPGPQRVAFAISIEIMPGEHIANGVACDGYLDEERNGKGSSNKQVFNHENGQSFTVKTADGKPAWMLIQCDGGVSSGYDIWAVNPSYSGVASNQPEQPYVQSEQPDQQTYNPDHIFVVPAWVSWIFTGAGLVFILAVLGFLFIGVVGLILWVWSTAVMWRISWVWGIAALVTGFLFPVIGPIIWLILSGIVSNWPGPQPMPS